MFDPESWCQIWSGFPTQCFEMLPRVCQWLLTRDVHTTNKEINKTLKDFMHQTVLSNGRKLNDSSLFFPIVTTIIKNVSRRSILELLSHHRFGSNGWVILLHQVWFVFTCDVLRDEPKTFADLNCLSVYFMLFLSPITKTLHISAPVPALLSSFRTLCDPPEEKFVHPDLDHQTVSRWRQYFNHWQNMI